MPANTKEDPQVQKVIEEFQSLKTEPALRQWEKIHRDMLQGLPFAVMGLFDSHWHSVVGQRYLIATTDIDIPKLQEMQRPGRIDPKGNNYKTERIFTEIQWKVMRESVGRGLNKEEFVTYELYGKHTEGRERLIAPKCKPERLAECLGEEVAHMILRDSKKADSGTITQVVRKENMNGKIKQTTDPLQLPVMVMGYWEVMFAGKANPEEKEDVELQWEGQCLQVQREVPAILPGCFIEVNDHAVHPVYIKQGDQPRKVIGHKQHFPCTILRECTKEEHDQQKAEGNRVTRMAHEQKGWL